MALTVRQRHELREAVRLVVNDLNQAIKHLQRIDQLRSDLPPAVGAFLEPLITAGKSSFVQFQVTTHRDQIRERLEALRGDGLDALRPAQPPGPGEA